MWIADSEAHSHRIDRRDPGGICPGFFASEVHSIVVETIRVDLEHRRQGLCKAFLQALCADPRFDMVVVEGVQNPVLADALRRWGWEWDPGVMDFYKIRG